MRYKDYFWMEELKRYDLSKIDDLIKIYFELK